MFTGDLSWCEEKTCTIASAWFLFSRGAHDYGYQDEELAFLLANDSDSFSRWEAGQTLCIRVIMGMIEELKAGGSAKVPELVVDAFRRLLTTEGGQSTLS